MARRDDREAEGAPLLREYTGDRIEGSNPSLSAIFFALKYNVKDIFAFDNS